MVSKIVEILKDEDGNYILPLGEDVVEQVGWKIGDVLEWVDNHDGTWTIKRKETMEKELVLVDCISTFRMRYVVEVPKGKKDWALDSVVMQEVEEMSQHHIGEEVVSHRVISEEEFLRVFDEDNDYLQRWEPEKKMRCIRRWEDEPAEEEKHSEYWYDTDRNR